ncbi:MAG TPA: AzlC family ABC transporter permease [Mobilitalea sp.]|nr:AzlC family ABC transporter permease [Mobilitalea sp.]
MTTKKAALRAALPHTIPVLTGYIILGAAFGILMDSQGYALYWTALSSTFIYAGSMQFLMVALLTQGVNPVNGFLITLMVNARHLFYGISMLGKYRGTGSLKPYLIFSLTDETFSLVCSTEPPKGIDRKWFLFFISILDHSYWIAGSLLGGIIGTIFELNTKGIEFVLTALFVVIFINQWKSTQNHLPALIGITGSIICRLIFGASDFIVPSMIFILLTVTCLRSPLEGRKC